MAWLVSAIGVLVVTLVVRDIFQTLWRPRGFGFLARAIVKCVWRCTMTLSRRGGRELAGPLGMLMAVAAWTALSVVGWALIYFPWMPDRFHFGTSLQPSTSPDLVSSLYLSVVTLATLGFGDITPASAVLRLITPIEALVGFVLLTAAISWVLQVYPALGRRRAVATELSILAETNARDVVERGEACAAASLLHSLTRALIGVTVDLTQYAESYYFWERTLSMSLPANLPAVLDLIEASQRSTHPEVRQAGASLRHAADGLAQRLSTFTAPLRKDSSAAEVFAAYARDHRRAA